MSEQATYRVVLENDARYISCHRQVSCVEAADRDEAGRFVQAQAESADPRGWRVVQVRETSQGSRETGYYRHGNAHLALA